MSFLLRSSYAIFSCLNSTVVFNITSADFILMSTDVTLKMPLESSQLKTTFNSILKSTDFSPFIEKLSIISVQK